jgi:hypothetical protein
MNPILLEAMKRNPELQHLGLTWFVLPCLTTGDENIHRYLPVYTQRVEPLIKNRLPLPTPFDRFGVVFVPKDRDCLFCAVVCVSPNLSKVVWCHGDPYTRVYIHRDGAKYKWFSDYYTADGVVDDPIGDIDALISSEVDQGSSFDVNAAKAVLAQVCAITEQPAVAYTSNPSPKNPSRIKRGKKPLFEWTTVVIQPRAPKAEPKGGTHASPRQHDRRGHWVTSPRGKRFWRKPSRVGKARDGIIFHDYAVRSQP